MSLYSILFVISITIFIQYVTYIVADFGVPQSISESAYLIKRNGKLKFYLVMLSIMLPLLIVWLGVTPNSDMQFLIFISCAALGFVGVTGDYRLSNLPKIVHSCSAMSCAILSQLWVLINMLYLLPLIIVSFIMAIVLGVFKKGTKRDLVTGNLVDTDYSVIFWLECAAFINTYIAVFTLLM